MNKYVSTILSVFLDKAFEGPLKKTELSDDMNTAIDRLYAFCMANIQKIEYMTIYQVAIRIALKEKDIVSYDSNMNNMLTNDNKVLFRLIRDHKLYSNSDIRKYKIMLDHRAYLAHYAYRELLLNYTMGQAIRIKKHCEDTLAAADEVEAMLNKYHTQLQLESYDPNSKLYGRVLKEVEKYRILKSWENRKRCYVK